MKRLLLVWTLAYAASGGSTEAFPTEATLAAPCEAPIVAHGEKIGSVKLPAGSAVTILSIESDGILLSRGGGAPFKVSNSVVPPGFLPPASTPTPLPVMAMDYISSMTGGGASSSKTSSATASGTKEEQLVQLFAQRDAAIAQVKAIINQPVFSVIRPPSNQIANYGPAWFHDGAIKPDFNTVDVRKTQEFPYEKAAEYSTSDLNPGKAFKSKNLEFNSMTKYFYTDRSVPKKRLSEPEMLEINRLYRIIGHCEQAINDLNNSTQTNRSVVSQPSGPSQESSTGTAPSGVMGFLNSNEKLLIGILAIILMVLFFLGK